MIFFFISLSTYFCYLILKYQKHLYLINKDKFKISKYYNNIIQHAKREFLTPELLGIIVIIIALNTDAKITGICMVILYLLLYLYELKGYKKQMKLNPDIIRTIVFIGIIYLIMFIGIFLDRLNLNNDFLIYNHTWIYYTTVIFVAYFSSIVTLVAGFFSNVIKRIFAKQKSKKK